ncbi:MAG TPA: SDR family oxidoreductase, partial [Dongiaceae bacterium]|nr:SDR family oxidoreductase [Dongiaceae bacterium]
MSTFSDKVVVVTGAAGGVGRSVAAHFLKAGARLALVDYSEDLLKKTFAETNADTQLLVACDLTNRDSTSEAFAKIIKRFGRIDVLANIAGGFIMGEAVHETSDKTWDFLFNLNTRSIVNTAAAAVPVMLKQGGGKIINVSAASSQKGVAQMGAYVASKSAVSRLTEAMSAELREQNINVNAILPSIIDT